MKSDPLRPARPLMPLPIWEPQTADRVHLVRTFDGTRWNLYRNGMPVASDTDLTGAVTVENATWAIGARGRWKNAFGILAGATMPERTFTGGIDEVAIYNYALSPARCSFVRPLKSWASSWRRSVIFA